MKHVAYVYTSGVTGSKASGSFDLLGDAVLFCEQESSTDDTCVIKEGYTTLTGQEDFGTIMTWTIEKETPYGF